MAFRFEWDPAKATTNLAKHGASFEEAMTAFSDALGRVEDDPRHSIGERRFALLGQSEQSRLLAVLFTDRGAAIRLVSARQATRRERRSYEESQD